MDDAELKMKSPCSLYRASQVWRRYRNRKRGGLPEAATEILGGWNLSQGGRDCPLESKATRAVEAAPFTTVNFGLTEAVFAIASCSLADPPQHVWGKAFLNRPG